AEVRKGAAESLAKMRSLEGLKTALANRDDRVRLIAIERLGGMSPGEIAISREMENETLPGLSALGREKLRSLYPPVTPADQRGYEADAVAPLVRALDETSESNATAAAKGLRNLGRTALPALTRLERAALEAPAAGTRVEALHALKNIGREGLPTIEKAVHDPDQHVREYAIALLGSDGSAGVPRTRTRTK